jgi:hypothetical protein
VWNGGAGGGALSGLNQSGERKERVRRTSPSSAKRERGGPAMRTAHGSRWLATARVRWRRAAVGRGDGKWARGKVTVPFSIY